MRLRKDNSDGRGLLVLVPETAEEIGLLAEFFRDRFPLPGYMDPTAEPPRYIAIFAPGMAVEMTGELISALQPPTTWLEIFGTKLRPGSAPPEERPDDVEPTGDEHIL